MVASSSGLPAEQYRGLKSLLRKAGLFTMLQKTKKYQDRRARIFFDIKIDKRPKCPGDELPGRRSTIYVREDKIDQIEDVFNNIRISLRPDARFQYWIDTGLYFSSSNKVIGNKSPNYDMAIHCSLQEMMELLGDGQGKMCEQNRRILKVIRAYVDRIIDEIGKASASNSGVAKENLEKARRFFQNIKTSGAKTLEEALQRLLFWSSLYWQTGRNLIGFGRLDKLLADFPVPDEHDEFIAILSDFITESHRFYCFKSNLLLGDTGQIIILGGKEQNGSYFCNAYTYAFIEVLRDLRLPDPKILLRVSRETPRNLIDISLDCIATGIGCPLFANDETVIPSLIEFGYSTEDAHGYVTSACWEPVACGKSLEENSMGAINCADAFVAMYETDRFTECQSIEEAFTLYCSELSKKIDALQQRLDSVVIDRDPLFSLFTDGCLESDKDMSEGGAVYNNYGVSIVGISNAVNSLIMLDELCFKSNDSNLLETQKELASDYEGEDSKRGNLAARCGYYGTDDERAVEITNKILAFIEKKCRQYRNPWGGKLKWGLSSSGYVDEGKTTAATLDGRHAGDPLAVHISAPMGTPYTELVQFASHLDYSGHCNNGNVVDFFIAPSLIINHKNEFIDFIYSSIDLGFFEMQMNVVDSKMLIEAKRHPEAYADLIVRVWGFSAFFIDLPEEYQDVLISRALASEKKTT